MITWKSSETVQICLGCLQPFDNPDDVYCAPCRYDGIEDWMDAPIYSLDDTDPAGDYEQPFN
jgi:hypothetical protein